MVEKNKLDADLQGTQFDAYILSWHDWIPPSSRFVSRPDLIYAVSLCARYQAKPIEKHLNAVKRIFRYLKETINMGLWYSKDIGDKLVSLSSKKLKRRAISSNRGEYIPYRYSAFGGNTRDLGSFGEETDKTTDLHQHLSRISTQKLETASQITRDAVTTHTKTASQDLKTASECLRKPAFVCIVVDMSRKIGFCRKDGIGEQRGTSSIRYHPVGENGCSFHRLLFEDPNQHLKDFLNLVDSLDLDSENRERMRLHLFQFSLRDQASNWLKRLPAGSITTWEDLTTRFLAQFFPPGRTAKLCNDILMFQQHHGESLSEAWTRFKDLLQKVPHHGIDL
ncbi:zinc finger, CCHC-type containing protein [Tanacetum coccineum]